MLTLQLSFYFLILLSIPFFLFEDILIRLINFHEFFFGNLCDVELIMETINFIMQTCDCLVEVLYLLQ